MRRLNYYYFNKKQKLYNLKVNLKTALSAIYMFAGLFLFYLSVDYYS